MMPIKVRFLIIAAVIAVAGFDVAACPLKPISRGAYFSGVRQPGRLVTFTAVGSYGRYPPTVWTECEWDFDYRGQWQPDQHIIDNLYATWTYPQAGTFVVAVKYFANGSGGNVYTFFVTIANGVQPPVSFAAARQFPTLEEGDPWPIAAGDLNGDQKLDIVVGNQDAGTSGNPDPYGTTVSVLLNTGVAGEAALNFAPQANFPVKGWDVFSVKIAELNLDQKPDIVATTSDHLAVLLNTTANGSTTASFTTAMVLPLTYEPLSVAVADFNQDGKQDVIVGYGTAGYVTVFMNTTSTTPPPPGTTKTPTFSTFNFSISGTSDCVFTADMNRDGKPDVVFANSGRANVSILANTTAPGSPTPTFAAQANFGTARSPSFVAVGDLNRDAWPDIVTEDTYLTQYRISLFVNRTPQGGAMSFDNIFVSRSQDPSDVAIGDLNQDAWPELAIVGGGTANASILLNTTSIAGSNPSFTAGGSFAAGTGSPTTIARADFNGDGWSDLAVVKTETYANVAVLANGRVTSGLSYATVLTHENASTATVPAANTPSSAQIWSFPNPFNPSTQIDYSLPAPGNVSLVVYDVLGREVATLASGYHDAGRYTARWNAASTASGVYFARLTVVGEAGKNISTKNIKMLLMK